VRERFAALVGDDDDDNDGVISSEQPMKE
jgi:hypothetical protein